MDISLTPKEAAFVDRLVKSGRFGSESEAAREAFRLLEEDERYLEELRRDIQESIKEADAGKAVPFDQAVVDRIKAEGREALARENQDV